MVVTIEHRRAKDRERQARRLSRLSPEERRQRWRHYQQEHRARVKVAEKAPAPLPAFVPPPPPVTDDDVAVFDAEMAALCAEEAPATSEPEPPADDAPEMDDDIVADLEGTISEGLADQRHITLDDSKVENASMHRDMESWRGTYRI
ncbi:UNVERIFIED_ORG: hypothetical protein ABID33_003331 [Xanthobacter viscosus]|uniref:Uncharacterized protein n=1 Tax=Xanthobacter autotrophicus TaxID=280 RepID=A0A6C1KLR9_XANAU|nr:hypothetical protein [Xanthobacter autotrophicus]TLX44791.1 hypothetical protein FBQ73_01715 [Xanthobacter autotrophicus]